MKRTATAIAWLVMMAAARAADIAATYHLNPDLSEEANPVVSLLGGGWTAIMIPNLLICAAVAVCTIKYWRAKPRVDLIPSAESVWDFAALALYGVKMGRVQFLRRLVLSLSLPPKPNRAFFWELCGFSFPPAITAGSLIAVFSWLATREWQIPWFIHFHGQMGYALLILPVMCVFAAAQAIYFCSEYRRALQSEQDRQPEK